MKKSFGKTMIMLGLGIFLFSCPSQQTTLRLESTSKQTIQHNRKNKIYAKSTEPCKKKAFFKKEFSLYPEYVQKHQEKLARRQSHVPVHEA